MSPIAIIDYDMGNLKSVAKALEQVGAKVLVTRDPKKIRDCEKIVLPGVGAFAQCIQNLKDYGLVEVIVQQINQGKYFLGICLGFQLLFEESAEWGCSKGLALLKGKVRAFPPSELKVPHMGWNQLKILGQPKLFQGIPDQSFFYFVHSYYVDPEEQVTATQTSYGVNFASSIEHNNIFATQFHPEKSQTLGLKVLKNFVSLKS